MAFPVRMEALWFHFLCVCLSLSSVYDDSPHYPYFLRCVLDYPVCLYVRFVCTSPLHFPSLHVCVTVCLSSEHYQTYFFFPRFSSSFPGCLSLRPVLSLTFLSTPLSGSFILVGLCLCCLIHGAIYDHVDN